MNPIEKDILFAVDHLAEEILDLPPAWSQAQCAGEREECPRSHGSRIEPVGLVRDACPHRSGKSSGPARFCARSLGCRWKVQHRGNKAGGRRRRPGALFNGHLDVVSPEPLSSWHVDPFTPYEKDGWLYGRGAGDMKGGIAAMTYALRAVEKAGLGLKAPVTIEGLSRRSAAATVRWRALRRATMPRQCSYRNLSVDPPHRPGRCGLV
jgi:acetylornithine deacetylase